MKPVYLFGVFLFFLLVFTWPAAHVAASSSVSPWLIPQSPYLTTYKSDIDTKDLPEHPNKPCVNDLSFTAKLTDYTRGHTLQQLSVCGIRTDFGVQSATSNHVMLNDQQISASVRSSTGSTLTLNPIPNSPHIMFQSGGLYGSYRFIVKNFKDSIDYKPQADGTLNIHLKQSVQPTPIKDKTGNLMEFSDVRFSDNGKWMIGDVPRVGMTRVSLETGEALPFGTPMNYAIGLNPHFVMAISSDGNYVATAETKYDFFRIYDLSACNTTCPYRDLIPVMHSNLPKFNSIHSVEFSTNTTLRLNVRSDNKNRLVTLTAHGQHESQLDYLALGDSFTSGEGAYDYAPYSDIRDPFNKCHLSLRSYPYLLQDIFNKRQSVACSGAKMTDILSTSKSKPQAIGKESSSFNDEIYQNFLVGYRPQIDFVVSTKPKTISLSIGGNDIGFSQIVSACVMPGTCYESTFEKQALSSFIHSKLNELSLTFRQIKNSGATDANVYIVGYPELVYPNGDCAINVRLNQQERLLANQLVGTINTVLKQAAHNSGAKFIDATSALHGSRLCEAKNSNITVNGLTAGDDKTFSIPLFNTGYQADFYLIGRESYHPNARGHELLADFIRKHIKNPQLATYQATGLPYDKNIQPIYLDTTIGQVFWTRDREDNRITSSGFAPDTPVQIKINGKHILTARSDDQGVINHIMPTTALMPIGIQPVQIHGMALSGTNTIQQKFIYIAATVSDIDGDTIKNETESCLFVNDITVDEDRDTISDACDGIIGDKQSTAETLSTTDTEQIPITISPESDTATVKEYDHQNDHLHIEPEKGRMLGNSANQLVYKGREHVDKIRTSYMHYLFASVVIIGIASMAYWRKHR